MANKQFSVSKQSLGQGAFGHVFRGTMIHKNTEIDVAIKRVNNDGDMYEVSRRNVIFYKPWKLRTMSSNF